MGSVFYVESRAKKDDPWRPGYKFGISWVSGKLIRVISQVSLSLSVGNFFEWLDGPNRFGSANSSQNLIEIQHDFLCQYLSE